MKINNLQFQTSLRNSGLNKVRCFLFLFFFFLQDLSEALTC